MKIPYATVEGSELLKLCMGSYVNATNKLRLLLDGTIPKAELEKIRKSFIIDATQWADFPGNKDKIVYLDSWSELFAMGCMAMYFNQKSTAKDWKVGVGIGAAYKESSLRERHLADGLLCSESMKAKSLFQECKAQNIKGSNEDVDIEADIIDKINRKVAKQINTPIPDLNLLVTVFGKEGLANSIDLKRVYQLTLAQNRNIFDTVFCIVVEDELKKVRIFRLDAAAADDVDTFLEHAFTINLRPV